jgi:hypothetical protein
MKANNDLEQEIAALEESWFDIGKRSSSVSGYGPLALAPFTGGASLAVAACGALLATAAAALPPHKTVTFNLRQRTELREKLSNTRSASEKARAELRRPKKNSNACKQLGMSKQTSRPCSAKSTESLNLPFRRSQYKQADSFQIILVFILYLP